MMGDSRAVNVEIVAGCGSSCTYVLGPNHLQICRPLDSS